MSEQKEKFADEILDKALANYSHAEPRLGLEGRVLARLDEEKQSPARVWKWAWAPAAAALLIAGGLYLSRPRPQGPAIPNVAVKTNPPVTAAPTQPQPPVVKAAAQTKPRVGARAQAAPRAAVAAARLPQFPAPQALSEQDRLLLAYVRLHPQAAAQQAEATAQPLAEMKIRPLEIPPLSPDGSQSAPER